MQFTINRDHFLTILETTCNIVEKNQTLPILSNILIKIGAQQLTAISTDLEIEITSSIGLQSDHEISFTLPARKTLSIVKSLPQGLDMTIFIKENRAILKTKLSQYTLFLLPPDSFPFIKDELKTFTTSLQIESDVFKSLLKSTSFCMGIQDVRYYLNGLNLKFNNNYITAVSSDGHRLAKFSTQLENINNNDTFDVIIPRKSVLELHRLIPNTNDILSLSMNEKVFSVKNQQHLFVTKLINQQYPDFQRVYPQVETKILIINRLELKEALARAAILSNIKFKGIKFLLTKTVLKIISNNPEHETAEEELAIQYEGNPIDLAFNVSYFIDILNQLHCEEIEMHIADTNSSCIIKPLNDHHIEYILMPMKI